MPQLSTGRKVAILLQRVADIIDNPLEHLDKLGQIDSVEQVCRFIPVVVFVESDGEREGHFELNQDSIRIHEIEGMRAVVQDYSVADVLNGNTDWSRQEVEDFERWFDEFGGRQKCVEMAAYLKQEKHKLTDLVDAMSYADIDPLQDEQERFRRASVFVRVLTGRKFSEEEKE
jgi:hypothetical protein